MMVLSIVVFLALLGVVFYHRVNLTLSSLILVAYTAAMGAIGLWSFWLLLPLAIVLLPLNLSSVRRSLLSAPALRAFRKVMPPMSTTEKEAIDAGTTWWEGDLFRGAPDWNKLHSYPKPRLTEEEQAFIDGPVEEACRMANDFQITHELADLPPELWAYLKEHRFFAMIIKKEYGGLEFSPYAQAMVLQKLAGVSGILAITVGVPNSLGPGELLQHYGTEEQKNHYLPGLAARRLATAPDDNASRPPAPVAARRRCTDGAAPGSPAGRRCTCPRTSPGTPPATPGSSCVSNRWRRARAKRRASPCRGYKTPWWSLHTAGTTFPVCRPA